MAVDDVSYYEYVGAIMDAERRDKLRRALGPSNKASREFFMHFVIIESLHRSMLTFCLTSIVSWSYYSWAGTHRRTDTRLMASLPRHPG